MESKNSFFYTIKLGIFSIFISIVLTILGVFLLSAILLFTNLGERFIESGIIFISSFSIIIGSIFLLCKIKEKGLLYGVLFGIVYIFVLYLISSIMLKDFSLGTPSIIMVLLGILGGAIGGIIGVNVKK